MDYFEVAKLGIALFTGLGGGACITWFFGARQEEHKRRLAFRQEQISRLYGPVLARLGQLDVCWDLYGHASEKVEEFAKKHSQTKGSDSLVDKRINAVGDYLAHIYQREIVIYGEITKIITDNYYLAEPQTIEYYKKITRFIENRNLITVVNNKLDINYTGDRELQPNLLDFQWNITVVHRSLREQIEQGKVQEIRATEFPREKNPLIENAN